MVGWVGDMNVDKDKGLGTGDKGGSQITLDDSIA